MTKLQRYIDQIFRSGSELKPGTVVEVVVRHDPWCARLKGGECDCDPEIEKTR
jgi:hypothetical protein